MNRGEMDETVGLKNMIIRKEQGEEDKKDSRG